jgi:hypothetical protein
MRAPENLLALRDGSQLERLNNLNPKGFDDRLQGKRTPFLETAWSEQIPVNRDIHLSSLNVAAAPRGGRWMR